jgi:RimJ/RimL family protein N-acetyltransferase
MELTSELPTLESPRLRLRQLHAADVPALFAVFSDHEVMRYWSHAPFRTIEQAEWYLRDIDAGRVNGTHYQWGIALLDSDAVIGTTTLFSLDRKNRRAEIGYALLSRQWKMGYASEALGQLIAYAFDHLGINRLEADIDPRNIASCRLVEKIGFKYEGELRERWYVEGEVQHSAIYGLLAREFVPSR